MNSSKREPLAIVGLLTDEDFDEMLEMDHFNGDPPSKRSDRELAGILAILDQLERSNG